MAISVAGYLIMALEFLQLAATLPILRAVPRIWQRQQSPERSQSMALRSTPMVVAEAVESALPLPPKTMNQFNFMEKDMSASAPPLRNGLCKSPPLLVLNSLSLMAPHQATTGPSEMQEGTCT